MSLVFTMPGKMGDALHQFPVVYWFCQQNNVKAKLWLDQTTCKPLVNLFASQPCIEAVELRPGITSWHMGGQPWDFGLEMKDHVEDEIYHLGMRKFPTRQITLETLDQVPLNITKPDNVRCLTIAHKASEARRCLLHGTFVSANGVPGFWRFLAQAHSDLALWFDEIWFTGSPAERERALELYPSAKQFDDEGDFLKLAEFMSTAGLVIGSGSSNVVLAGLLGIPAIRVHDPIGDHPRVIWSNLGENQLNLTERELRKDWPVFRDKWLDAEVLR